MYKNKGPVKFEKLVIKIVPEDSSRVAAMMAGQFDITHQFPAQFIAQAKAAPMLQVDGQAELPAALFRLQDDAADGGRQAGARGHEHRHQPRRDRQGHPARQRRAGLHHRRPKERSTYDPKTTGIVKEDVERAKKLLDEAGWKPGADGIREKDGVKLAPKVYFTANANSPASPRRSRAICAGSASLAAPALGLDHRGGQDGRAGLRDLVGDRALPLGRRPDEHLLRFQEHPDAQPHELEGRRDRRMAEARPRGADRGRTRQVLRAGAAEGRCRSTCGCRCSTSTWTRSPTRR